MKIKIPDEARGVQVTRIFTLNAGIVVLMLGMVFSGAAADAVHTHAGRGERGGGDGRLARCCAAEAGEAGAAVPVWCNYPLLYCGRVHAAVRCGLGQ